MQVCKYVESNASRSKLSKRAEEWRWSSAWIRKYGNLEQKSLLSGWPIQIPKDYASFLNQKDKEEDLIDIRLSVNKGRPFGSINWIEKIADKFKLKSTLNPRGRLKKGT